MKISVIMLTMNSSPWLDEVLAPIANAKEKYDFELVIVDGGSKDDTLSKIREVAERNSLHVKIIREFSKNLAHARNLGLRNASGEFQSFIDSDIVVPRDFFDTMLSHLTDESVGIAGARFELERDPPKGFVAKYYRNRTDIYRRGLHKADYTTTACSVWPKKAVENLAIDERFHRAGEDVDFNLRIKERGYTCLVDADCVAWHIRTATVSEELKRVWAHGESRALNLKLHWNSIGRGPRTILASLLTLLCWICLLSIPFIGVWGLFPLGTILVRQATKLKEPWRVDHVLFGFLLFATYTSRFLWGCLKYA